MTVLSDLQLFDALREGHVVCRPLVPENVRGASIDLTLGEHFWRCDARPNGVINPCDPTERERYFAGPFQAKPYADVYEKIGWRERGWPLPGGYRGPMNGYETAPSPFANIPDDHPVIVLRPRERILAHSNEFAGIHPPGTSSLQARSTTGRWGMAVCRCAGQGDPGWVGRWTWELSNDNDEAIVIPTGIRMAQVVFSTTGPVSCHYGDIGNYQSDRQLNAVIEAWDPVQMLPNVFKVEPIDSDLSIEHYAAALEQLPRTQRRRPRGFSLLVGQ